MRQSHALQSLINSLSTNAVRKTHVNRICSRILRHRHSHGDFTSRIMTSGSPSMSVDQFHKLIHLCFICLLPPQIPTLTTATTTRRRIISCQVYKSQRGKKQFHDRARSTMFATCDMYFYVFYILCRCSSYLPAQLGGAM